LEKSQLLSSSVEVQDTRPSKRVFKLTAMGRKRFREWLHSPVHLMRDFRIELFGKLFFFHHLALGGAEQLVLDQMDVLKKILKNLQRQEKKETDAFRKLIFRYKQKAARSALNWLMKDAKPFMDK
jgi:DNA-binding PadR family transcriptional regulator